MSDHTTNADRVFDLAGAICDESASQDDLVELDSMVVADRTSRRCYWDYCWMHVMLGMEARVQRAIQKAREQDCLDPSMLAPWEYEALMSSALPMNLSAASAPANSPGTAVLAVDLGSLATSESVIVAMPPVAPASSPPAPLFLHNTIQSTVGYFSSGWPVAYLVATVVLGVGLLIGAFVHVSDPSQIATDTRETGSHRQNDASRRPDLFRSSPQPFVGRITGMVDCQWADPATEAVNGASVPLGRRYALASGLMEITYDSGANVILQGPVTYEVESKAGGYLSVGKLTARLEKKSNLPSPSGRGAGGERSVSSLNPSSFILHPLFSVRTPTATVTDLGTEFGVEVDKHGSTTSHVFRGSVELQLAARDGRHGQTVRLNESESARVEKQTGGESLIIRRDSVDPAAFVRVEQLPKLAEEQKPESFRRWQACSEQLRHDPALVAYYDFQRRAGSPRVLHAVTNSADGITDGVIEGATWTTGRMPGKHALRFHGADGGVRVYLPHRMTQMTLAAWVMIDFIDKTDHSSGLLMSDGWNEFPGKCHWQIGHEGRIYFGTDVGGGIITEPILPEQEWGQDRWRHVVVVADPANRRAMCYLDGKRLLATGIGEDYFVTFGAAEIGNWWSTNDRNERGLYGRMDELMIFARAMTDQDITGLYQTGKR